MTVIRISLRVTARDWCQARNCARCTAESGKATGPPPGSAFRMVGSVNIASVYPPVLIMKRLCKAASLPDAHILRGLLGQEGIEAHVFNENAQSGVGQLPVAEALPELWVDDEKDWQRAMEVVRGFEAAPRIDATLRCTACGEDNPGNFQVCWSCGAGL